MRIGSGINDIYTPKLHILIWFSYADSFLRKDIELNIETKSNFGELIILII